MISNARQSLLFIIRLLPSVEPLRFLNSLTLFSADMRTMICLAPRYAGVYKILFIVRNSTLCILDVNIPSILLQIATDMPNSHSYRATVIARKIYIIIGSRIFTHTFRVVVRIYSPSLNYCYYKATRDLVLRTKISKCRNVRNFVYSVCVARVPLPFPWRVYLAARSFENRFDARCFFVVRCAHGEVTPVS